MDELYFICNDLEICLVCSDNESSLSDQNLEDGKLAQEFGE